MRALRAFLEITFGATLVVFAGVGGTAIAQSGPPIRVIVPFPPGGTADLLARVVTQQIGETTKQTMIIENRPGAGASIAYELTARALPDGNTVVIAANSVVINPLLRKVNFDPVKSFSPICDLVASPLIFVVSTASAYKTIDELIAAAHAKPGLLTIAALGPATTQHIAFESFKRATKTDMIFVPFSGGAPAVNALLGQHVDVALVNYSEAVEQIKAGKLRALATTSASRLNAAPELSTVAESGYPGYSAEVWLGVLAPARPAAESLSLRTGSPRPCSRPKCAISLKLLAFIPRCDAAKILRISSTLNQATTRTSFAMQISRWSDVPNVATIK